MMGKNASQNFTQVKTEPKTLLWTRIFPLVLVEMRTDTLNR